MAPCEHRKSFKDSIKGFKALQADIQLANAIALRLPEESTDFRLQMRLGFGPAVLLYFFSWANCTLVGSLGLIHVLIDKVSQDGTTTMSTHVRKASLRQFYGYILPCLQTLESGINTRMEVPSKQIQTLCRFTVEANHVLPHADLERERECCICLEVVPKILLPVPNCYHSMCFKCYQDWRSRSLSCPFCQVSLKNVNSEDLWVFVDQNDTADSETLWRINLQLVHLYVNKLPSVVCNNRHICNHAM